MRQSCWDIYTLTLALFEVPYLDSFLSDFVQHNAVDEYPLTKDGVFIRAKTKLFASGKKEIRKLRDLCDRNNHPMGPGLPRTQ